MPEPKLFEEFPPVATERWEEQIRLELDGADYGESLLWHTPDGITVRPYYRSGDLRRLQHADVSSGVTVPRSWTIRQDILVSDLESTLEHVLAAFDGGAESIGLVYSGDDAGTDLRSLVARLPGETSIHVDAGPVRHDVLRDLLVEGAFDRVNLAFDPLGNAARTGRYSGQDFSLAMDALTSPNRYLRADSSAYHDRGATLVQETSLLLAAVSEYLTQLLERGARVADVLPHLFVNVTVGPSYFIEVARLRAIRLLIPQVVEAFNPGEKTDPLPVHAVTSLRNTAPGDSYMNLLRTTSEACAAVVGGCDVLAVQPFDRPDCGGFSYRLARNVQLILRHEAYLDKVGDPSAGSYYVEILTDAVARRAWQLFKEIEAAGGLLKGLESGFIHRMIEEKR